MRRLPKEKFLAYLSYTVIPDLQSAGRSGPARDLKKCVSLGLDRRRDARFATTLRQTARVYRNTGREDMARDYERCARIVAPPRRK
jgi:hypothetical protein